MRRLKRWTLRVLLGLVVLVVAGAGFGWWWLNASLPELTGSYSLKGLKAPVRIVRDRNAVPHIYARSMADASYALGFIHAQDRLFQMETQRRIGAGRMSEVAGSATLRFDRLMRVLGLYRLAEASYAKLDAPTRQALDAYTAGVNAYLANRRERLPPEFLLAGSPEPWKAADSLVWGKLMALNLSTSWREKLQRGLMVQRIGADKARAFFPPYPADGPTTLRRDRASLSPVPPADLPLAELWAALPEAMRTGGASNEWVVSGTRTASGKPILANDPHLGLDAPSMWYLVRIETPEGMVAGASVPGVPFVVIGHNSNIAWGVTTPYVEGEDLIMERLDPEQAGHYLTPEGGKPFATRTETIRVRFGETVTMTVRESRHGPILDDALDERQRPRLAPNHVLALRAPWLTADDTTAEALLGINRARNWDEFGQALSRYVAPAQNFVYADTTGNIGYYLPGRIPLRTVDEGGMPKPGWDESRAAARYIPFAELPQAFNPPGGMIVNANNRIALVDYPYFLSRDWGDHYRAARIEALLAATPKHNVDTTGAIQGDRVSLMARDLLPLLLAVPAAQPRHKSAAAALARLRAWDGTMDREKPEPLLFTAWLVELNRLLYADELGAFANEYVGLRPETVRYMLTEAPAWCDNVTTPAAETCADILAAALDAALARLTPTQGDDIAKWRWGDVHFAEMRHRLFSFLPLVGNFGTLRIPADGDDKTVNKASMFVRDPKSPFAARAGAGVRAIYTLDDLSSSRFILSTGPAGHPLSPYYGSMLFHWRDIRYVRFADSMVDAERDAAGIIDMKPAP